MQIGKRTFGIEIESIISRCHKHQKHSDLLKSFSSSSTVWNIVEDKSIQCENERFIDKSSSLKCEIVSPRLTFNNLTMRSIETLCNDLQYKINANINQSCGFHIHFDTEDLSINDIIKIAVNYSYFENVIDLFMDKTRRGNDNHYIKSIQLPIYKNIDDLSEIIDNPYYNKASLSVLDMINPNRKRHKYNFTNLFYHNLNKIGLNDDDINGKKSNNYINTIENRHHHSTLNYYDMLNWIRFNLLFIHHSQNKPFFVQNLIKNDMKIIKNANETVVYSKINPIDPFNKFEALAQFIDNDEIMEYYQQKL